MSCLPDHCHPETEPLTQLKWSLTGPWRSQESAGSPKKHTAVTVSDLLPCWTNCWPSLRDLLLWCPLLLQQTHTAHRTATMTFYKTFEAANALITSLGCSLCRACISAAHLKLLQWFCGFVRAARGGETWAWKQQSHTKNKMHQTKSET